MMSRRAGYSLIETMMVVTLISIGSSAALIQLKKTTSALDADAASAQVIAQIKYARVLAVTHRRNVRLEFISPATVKVTLLESGGDTVMAEETLPSDYTFGLPTGIGDTPDGYGNTDGVSFNGDDGGLFLSDGSFIDDDGVLRSGTVFTIGPGGNGSARAVTLAGASGRVKNYYIKNSEWVQK